MKIEVICKVHSGKEVSAVEMLVYNSEDPAESCDKIWICTRLSYFSFEAT